MKKFLASVLVLTSLSCFSVMSSYATNEPMCCSNSSNVCDLSNDNITKLGANIIDNDFCPAGDNAQSLAPCNVIDTLYFRCQDNTAKCYDNFFHWLVDNKIRFTAICEAIIGVVGPAVLLNQKHLVNPVNSIINLF